MKQQLLKKNISLSEEDLYASALSMILFVCGRCLNMACPHLLYAIIISYIYIYVYISLYHTNYNGYLVSELCLNIFTISLSLKNDTDTKSSDVKEDFALCFSFSMVPTETPIDIIYFFEKVFKKWVFEVYNFLLFNLTISISLIPFNPPIVLSKTNVNCLSKCMEINGFQNLFSSNF